MADGSSIDLGDTAVAQVNINGTEVTLDANKPGQYAFLDSGDLAYAERNSALISGTQLTGSNPGSFEVEFRGGSAANPDIRLVSFNTSDPLVDSQNDYRFVQTDAQGRVTTTDVSPITRNIDGVDVIVGSSRFVGVTQNGQPISQTSTELQTQAGTGSQITATDAKLYSNGVLSSHTETTQTSSASGLIPIETVVKTFGAQGALLQTSTTTPDPDGSQNIIVRNGNGTTLYTSNLRYFDDDAGQSSLTETTYPNGTVHTLATDTTGRPASLSITTPTGNNTESVENYTYNSTGQRTLRFSSTVETFYDETGTSRLETVTTYPNGIPTTVRNAYDTDGQLASSTPVENSAATQLLGRRSVTTLNDIAGLIGAIQGGRPLPILNSGLHLVNNIANPLDINGKRIVDYPGLNIGTGIVSGLASLYNLANALEHGDTLTKISATLNTLNYVNSTLPAMFGGTALSPALEGVLTGSTASGAAGGLVNGVAPGVLPVLGLIVAIKNEDPVGIAIGLIGICNPALLATPPAGWIIVGVLILQALMKDPPPEAWGTAKVIFDGNGQIRIDSVGESFGIERVRGQMTVTLDVLGGMLAEAKLNTPGVQLGIVPQRLPAITWRESRQGDPGYAVLDINPLTGEQRYPYLRFDDRGTPFSSNPAVWQPDPRDPGIRVGMTRQLIESGLRRQAIAAQWEVDTAHIQQDIGDPNALDETTAHHVFDGGPPTYRHIKVTRLFFEHAANESCLRRLA